MRVEIGIVIRRTTEMSAFNAIQISTLQRFYVKSRKLRDSPKKLKTFQISLCVDIPVEHEKIEGKWKTYEFNDSPIIGEGANPAALN